MSIIGNKFIAIEYNSEDEKKIATYFMSIFNSDPNYFEGILNGLSTISAKELPIPIYNEFDRNKLTDYILEKNNANHTFCSNIIPSVKDIRLALMKWFFDNPQGFEAQYIYYQLAYDYLLRTGECEYLKKHFYSDEFERSDISELCAYEMADCYEELLCEKIKSFHSSNLYYEIIKNINIVYRVIDFTIKQQKRKKNKSVKIPKLSKKRFDELVVNTISYIDPTNKLLEACLELKENDMINPSNKEMDETGYFEVENRFTHEITERFIYIKNMSRNLENLKDLLHELGHYFYRTTIENKLLSEYPSIYFEKKALEYLAKIGYDTAIVEEIKKDRIISNRKALDYFMPSLYCIECNTDIGEYHIEEVKKFADGHKVKAPNAIIEKYVLDKDNKNSTKDKLISRIGTLNRVSDDINHLKYFIGDYLATYSINNLPHEEVLRILEDIQLNERSLKEVFDMIDARTQGYEIDAPKQKQV